MIGRPPRSTLFPYTTLSRSHQGRRPQSSPPGPSARRTRPVRFLRVASSSWPIDRRIWSAWARVKPPPPPPCCPSPAAPPPPPASASLGGAPPPPPPPAGGTFLLAPPPPRRRTASSRFHFAAGWRGWSNRASRYARSASARCASRLLLSATDSRKATRPRL